MFVLDRHGACLSRTWVLYELWAATLPAAGTAACTAVHTAAACTAASTAAGNSGRYPRRDCQLTVLLEAGGSASSWANLSHAYAALDIEASEGGRQPGGDEARLMERMAEGAGALSSSAAAVAARTSTALSRVVHRIKVGSVTNLRTEEEKGVISSDFVC